MRDGEVLTSVKILRENGDIAGIDVQGHSGYSHYGSDIVCAAVTSAVRLLESAVNDVLMLGVPVSIDSGGAKIKMILPAHCRRNECVRVVMEAFALYMAQISHEYEENIQVLEVSLC